VVVLLLPRINRLNQKVSIIFMRNLSNPSEYTFVLYCDRTVRLYNNIIINYVMSLPQYIIIISCYNNIKGDIFLFQSINIYFLEKYLSKGDIYFHYFKYIIVITTQH